MKENLNLSVSQHFAGQLVRVDTPAGSVVGVLRDANRHLMLESPRGWTIIAKWLAIKRRLPEALK